MPKFYNDNEHTERCRERTIRIGKEIARYEAVWPYHCPVCRASGELEYNGELDFCSKCLLSDWCPRCSKPFYYEYADSECAECGFFVGDDSECPHYPECCCEETE